MAAAVESPRTGARRWLIAILLVSLSINTIGLTWGLPNDNGTWAADSLQPLTPMAIGKHALFGERWNSGWFYFKYPLGHPLLVLGAQVPYLAWLRISGQFRSPASTYPYGFKHPARALSGLALIQRLVSALMGVGLVALAYVLASLLFTPFTGIAAAAATAGCYPVVFYAHTSNVDVPLMFWIALTVTGTVTTAMRGSQAAALLTGAAAAMALLTKEQSIGALAAVPIVYFLARPAAVRRLAWREIGGHIAAAASSFVAVTVVLGDVWWNPVGYINRWRFLLGTLPAAIREKYAPYQMMVQVPKGFSLTHEAAQALKALSAVAHAVTLPIAVMAVVGIAAAVWRRPRSAAIPLVVCAAYYLLTVRATVVLQVRYTMPLLFFTIMFAAVAIDAIWQMMRDAGPALRAASSVMIVAALACALLPGIEVTRLLVHDPRYAAEAWLKAHVPPAARVEIYQPETYLPRFNDHLDVKRIAVEERTVDAFRQRRPDFIVLSGGGRAGLTGHYAKDWHPGEPVFVDLEAAKDFFRQLQSEQLGYHPVAQFRTPMRWITPRINSLNPQITIFARAE